MRSLLILLICFVISDQAAAYDKNFSTEPIRWVVAPNARFDPQITDKLTIGIMGTAFYGRQVKAVDFRGPEIGAALTYNFSGAFTESWFLEAIGKYGDLRAQAFDSTGTSYVRQLDNWGARAVGGYHWYWGHFNLQLGAGAQYNSAGDQTLGPQRTRIPLYRTAFVAEFLLGFAI